MTVSQIYRCVGTKTSLRRLIGQTACFDRSKRFQLLSGVHYPTCNSLDLHVNLLPFLFRDYGVHHEVVQFGRWGCGRVRVHVQKPLLLLDDEIPIRVQIFNRVALSLTGVANVDVSVDPVHLLNIKLLRNDLNVLFSLALSLLPLTLRRITRLLVGAHAPHVASAEGAKHEDKREGPSHDQHNGRQIGNAQRHYCCF